MPDPATLKCRSDHPLAHRVPGYTESNKFKCDYCAKVSVAGVPSYNCYACTFDICLQCVASGAAEKNAPPPLAIATGPNAAATPGAPVFKRTLEQVPMPEVTLASIFLFSCSSDAQPSCTPVASGLVLKIESVSNLPSKSSDLYCKIGCNGLQFDTQKFNPGKDFQKAGKREFRYFQCFFSLVCFVYTSSQIHTQLVKYVGCGYRSLRE